MATTTRMQEPNIVLGKITDANGRPLPDLKVEIYDVDMRSWEPLASMLSGKDGSYRLQWTHEQLSGRGRKTADIALKVFTRENNTELYASSFEEIRFNAGERTEINLSLKAPVPREYVEYDLLLREAGFLAAKVPMAELQENKEFRDISFLSAELSVPAIKLEHLALAHRVNVISEVDPDFFYGLLRTDVLLHNSLSENRRTRLSAGIHTDPQQLLYDAALTDVKALEKAIKQAVEEKICPPSTWKQFKKNAGILARYEKEAQAYYKDEYPQKTLGLLTSLFKKDKLQEIQQLYADNKNDLNTFFETLSDGAFFEDARKDGKKDMAGALGKIIGYGDELLPRVLKSQGIKKPEDLHKLARLNKEGWVKAIAKTGSGGDKKQADIYASLMVRRFEKEFPTAAFAAQLAREKKKVLANQEQIVSFLDKHSAFDLTRSNIDLYLQEKKVPAAETEAVRAELKSVQRIFRLIPHYGKTLALRNEKVRSAQDIVGYGKTRFVWEIAPKAGLSSKEALQIYRRAETRHTAAMLVAGEMQDSVAVTDIAAFESKGLSKKIEAISQDFPNLKSLFKITDTCACAHCRSVYSPAAYLVEILQFLDKRLVSGSNAKSVLFGRRPDLGEIDLSCANANTPVKYIDLVCELLEEFIAPDAGVPFTGKLSDNGGDPLKGRISNALYTTLRNAGLPVSENAEVFETESAVSSANLPHYLRDSKLVCRIERTGVNKYRVYRLRQTLSSAEELDAAPEYVNTAAYEILGKEKFAFSLPFDLSHTEARAYFNRFDLERSLLMKAFQVPGSPADAAIAAEKAGLSPAEHAIIATTPNPNNNAAQQVFWNVPSPGNVLSYLQAADRFLDRTQLSYKELEILLKLRFIDSNGKLFIEHQDLGCDTSKKTISGLNLSALDRIHRFLRLQKKTGIPAPVLDEIISQQKLGAGKLNNDTLIRLAELMQIREKTGIKMEELSGCFGEIPHTLLSEDGPKPLYYQVFQNKAKNGHTEDGMLPEKVDGSQLLSTYSAYIATCLQIKLKDLELLLPTLPDQALTMANLSRLLAASRFIKKLKLKPGDFIILSRLSGIQVSDSPADALRFIGICEKFRLSPLKAEDLRFVLNHEAANLSDRVLKDEKAAEIIGRIAAEYSRIDTEQASRFDANLSAAEQQESLLLVLSALEGLSEEMVNTVLGFQEKNWVSAAAAKQYTDQHFPAGIDRSTINTAIDALDAAGPDTSTEQKDLVKALLDSVAAYYRAKARQTALLQLMAAAFKTEADMCQVVLNSARLVQPAPGTDIPAELFSGDLSNAPTEANYPKQYAALRLMHILFPLLRALGTDATDTRWFLENNAAAGWFRPDGIPYTAGQNAASAEDFLDFLQVLAYTRSLSPVADPADAEKVHSFFSFAGMLLPASTATRDEILQTLALLTAYEKEDLSDIDAHLFPVFSKSNYLDVNNLDRLLSCAAMLHTLSTDVTAVLSYIKPQLGNDEVNSLRATLKARYDEDTWLSTLREISDSIRPQKRRALVAYILATETGIKDENDLYEYFLVDVEMGSCMPSSRIVQAHNSIQLFVQRCLMGLEPDALADTENDPAWKQWQWMKNYRVWEANRKVFLYPENWYDVSLSDNPSYQLREFINELQQNELTNDTAEDALKKYMEKLDQVAFLEVMASWYDVAERDMHVFARTKGGDPAIYYYRRFENERYWTPWEKVELDISGNHLLAFKRNSRLHLAWPVFSEEPDPEQGAKLPNQSSSQEQPIDKPRKKLKTQLAISEYSNKRWQPKRVSHESILTPGTNEPYTSDVIPRDTFRFFYNEWADQIVCFAEKRTWVQYGEFNGEYQNISILAGAFDITGCKGYPEKAPAQPFNLNFIPKFEDTSLLEQRYKEMNLVAGDMLAVRNMHAFFGGYSTDTLLYSTPGRFRISYPHQFTQIDLVCLGYQLILYILAALNGKGKELNLKMPLGTLLPYFKEDSAHAYVIIPGYYKRTKRDGAGNTGTFTDAEKRTASDLFQLMDDIVTWFGGMLQEFENNPPANANEMVQAIVSDPGFQDLITEISHYEMLEFILAALVGKTGDPAFDARLKDMIQAQGLEYGEQFKNMYHPLVCALRTTLNKDGIPGLMKRETQMKQTAFSFQGHYAPNTYLVPQGMLKQPDGSLLPSFPVEDLDFSSDGSYSVYNWDLFFRVPLHIAGSLTQNQRFEEAMTWFHYMFNPTGALPGNGVQKYWVTKPFFLNQEEDYIAQRIDKLMYATANPDSPEIKELEFAISEWRNKPFRPDAVARFRPVAYQKALLMKYIDNLTEWGDQLFRQDTMESIAQATQMYVLADKLLGPKPRIVSPLAEPPYMTYNQVEAGIDAFGNALIELENILPDLSVLPEGGEELPTPPVTLSMLYFCIPPNEKMAEYWDRVADRLFKIRHCQNIDGIERSLALFAPPIDPGMLVRAAASGLDLSSVLAGLNAPTPYYRFQMLAQKSTELTQEVRGLGSSLLQALEKKDSEALSLLRNELELKVLNAVTAVKKLQISESAEQITVLERSRKVTEERQKYYAGLEKISGKEQLSLDKLEEANEYQFEAQIVRTVAGALRLVPEFHVGASGFGGSPHVVFQMGGSAMSTATSIGADILNILGSMASYEAGRASTLGSYERRFDDWKLQELLAEKEISSIDKQIEAAKIRKEIAETDLKNHELQIENAKKSDEFMRSKFTNKELYQWMSGQISAVYFRAYQLAHDFAKKAERSYRFELGSDDSYISYGYWDSMKKGLQSADQLLHDIKRMETGYLDKNKREYEITKHVSLAQLDPLALVKLRATGACDFDVPEVLYDMDHPGQYFRRIRSASVSIPCVAGPYTSVSARLSLVKNKYRKNTNADNLAGTGYAEDPGNDERFVYNIGAIQSIATSSAQNDSGVFELSFKDERYLPFEGTGAASSWRLELPAEVRQFDYATIADVIIHVKYTAREGGSSLKSLANGALRDQLAIIKQNLAQEGLHTAINLKQDLAREWHLLKQNGSISLQIDKFRLPYMAQPFEAEISQVMFIARVQGNPGTFTLLIDGADLDLASVSELQMCKGISYDIELGTSFDLALAPTDAAKLEDLMLLVKYSF